MRNQLVKCSHVWHLRRPKYQLNVKMSPSHQPCNPSSRCSCTHCTVYTISAINGQVKEVWFQIKKGLPIVRLGCNDDATVCLVINSGQLTSTMGERSVLFSQLHPSSPLLRWPPLPAPLLPSPTFVSNALGHNADNVTGRSLCTRYLRHWSVYDLTDIPVVVIVFSFE